MNFSDMFEDILDDRSVIPAAHLRRFKCPFHNDGDDPKRWSAVGYPDGYAHCFGCKASFSVLDLEVRRCIGRCVTVGEKIKNDPEMRDLYIKLKEEDPRFKDLGKGGTTGEWKSRERRHYTELEQHFLWRVYDLMRRSLMGRPVAGRRRGMADARALAYLEARGCGPLECIGVARAWQMPYVHAIAKELGDETLPYTTGIESRNEKYKSRMHFLVKDSIVVFRFGAGETVPYYQARTLEDTRDHRYYCPPDVERLPLLFGSGPTLAAEGFFTIAGFVNHGFQAMAFLGHPPQAFAADLFKPLYGGIYIADRNDPDERGRRAGTIAAQSVYDKVTYSGGTVQIVYPSAPFRQADAWADAVGWDRAARYLHSRLELADYGLQTKEAFHAHQPRVVRAVRAG